MEILQGSTKNFFKFQKNFKDIFKVLKKIFGMF